jgi:hypothetical protein
MRVLSSVDETKYDEGLEKREQIGLEKGKIEIALNMIKAGLDKEIIA